MILPEYKTQEYQVLVQKIIAVLREAGFGAGKGSSWQGVYLFMPFLPEAARKPGVLGRLAGKGSLRTDLIGFLWLYNEVRSATSTSPVLDYSEEYFEQCRSAAQALADKIGLTVRLNPYGWDSWEVDTEGRIHDKYPGGF